MFKQVSRLKQVTRETISRTDQTDIPTDVSNLIQKCSRLTKLYESCIENTLTHFPEHKITTKYANDPVQAESLYAVSNAINDLGTEYKSEYLSDLCEIFKQMAKLQHDLNKTVHQDFIDPKKSYIKSNSEAIKHYETLKQRRIDLDSKKHKLKENKNDTKTRKYEADVDSYQEKFDREADGVREFLGPLVDESMIEEQRRQAEGMVCALRRFFCEGLELLDEFETKYTVNVELKENVKPVLVNGINSVSRINPPVVMAVPGGVKPVLQYATPSPKSPSQVTHSLAKPVLLPKPSVPLPTKPLKSTAPKCIALYNFAKEQDGDLELNEGDLVEIISKNEEWWKGKNVRTGESGLFPGNYVKLL